jgi:hypothetical protein
LAVTALLAPFVLLAAIGLVLSIIAHTAALFGQPQPFGPITWGLHIGIFVVWLPVVLVSNRLVADFKRKDYWQAALRGCPAWMKWMTGVFFVYAFVNFFLFMLVAPPRGKGGGVNAPPEVFRGFSGHWMAFYSAAVAILYSAIMVAIRDPARRCPNGHPVSPSADYCETCGGRIVDTDTDT